MCEIQEWTSVVTAVATALGVLVVAVGGFFAWRQLKGLRQQTGLSALAHIFEDFNSEKLREDRRLIYQKMPKEPDLATIDEELYESVRRVLVSLTRIGFLVHQGLIPMDEALAQFIGPPAIRMWGKLEKLVVLERERRDEKTYACFFEELVHRCERQLPNYKPVYF